ncbi:MAG: tetraacyldisaccharide 4'-kinase [Inquilinaceae bacterium]
MKTPRFWYRQPGSAAALLSPAAALWGLGGTLRRRTSRPASAPVPIICVGNVVAGGAGKTPVVLALAETCAVGGRRPHLLSRGYGGRLRGPVRVDPDTHSARDVGDEPLLLARSAPTWVARDRLAGARAAAAAGAGMIILDDGLQNPRLHKDLALLVVDGETGFGNGRLIPAGPLREPPAVALARADAVIVMGTDRHGLADGAAAAGRPILQARLEPDDDAARLKGKPVVAFAGIARPAKFFATLEGIGARLVARFAFPDHHRFDPDELMQMADLAAASGARLVTTEKDHVRLPVEARGITETIGIHVVWSDPAAVDALLAGIPAS